MLLENQAHSAVGDHQGCVLPSAFTAWLKVGLFRENVSVGCPYSNDGKSQTTLICFSALELRVR